MISDLIQLAINRVFLKDSTSIKRKERKMKKL